MEHPKAIGDRSTLAIMSALREIGYGLYVPFGENTRIDLILEDGDRLLRVQCKTGRLRDGAVRFKVCSSYGHHRRPRQVGRDYLGEIDCFAIYCTDNSRVYLVPIEEIPLRWQGALRVDPPRNNQYRRVRFAGDYEVGRVEIAATASSQQRATAGAGGSCA